MSSFFIKAGKSYPARVHVAGQVKIATVAKRSTYPYQDSINASEFF